MKRIHRKRVYGADVTLKQHGDTGKKLESRLSFPLMLCHESKQLQTTFTQSLSVTNIERISLKIIRNINLLPLEATPFNECKSSPKGLRPVTVTLL